MSFGNKVKIEKNIWKFALKITKQNVCCEPSCSYLESILDMSYQSICDTELKIIHFVFDKMVCSAHVLSVE